MSKRKIGFVLISHSERPLPSTRISVLNMLTYLRKASYEWEIFFEPPTPTEEPDVEGVAQRMLRAGVSIAYFQKVRGSSVLQEVQVLERNGVMSIYGVCDFVDNELTRACTATVAVTDYLRSLYDPGLQHKIHVVHDGIERPDVRKTRWAHSGADARVRAVLVNAIALNELPVFGTPPRFVEVWVVGRYPLADARFGHLRETWWTLRGRGNASGKRAALKWLLARPFRKIEWNFDTVYEVMLASDIGIIPIDPDPTPASRLPVPSWQVRSENRLTLKMALGLPVIASPVPSYLPIIEHGRNGYIARTRDEWIRCFEELRDASKREAIGKAARECVLSRYSMQEQARKLIAVLDMLGNVRG